MERTRRAAAFKNRLKIAYKDGNLIEIRKITDELKDYEKELRARLKDTEKPKDQVKESKVQNIKTIDVDRIYPADPVWGVMYK